MVQLIPGQFLIAMWALIDIRWNLSSAKGTVKGSPFYLFTAFQAAPLADKILGGIPAGTIPVVSAEPYFQLNFRAAEKLGLKVNEGLLSRAEEIIR